MKKTITFCLTILLVTLGYSQKNDNSKQLITEERNLSSYSEIEVAGAYTLILTKGKVGEITVKAPENVLPHLNTEVTNGILTISIDKHYSLKSKLMVYVPVDKHLKRVLSKGAIDISSDTAVEADNLLLKLTGGGEIKATVKTSSLALEIAGAGNIKVDGNTQELSSAIKGAGDIKTPDLKAEKATLRISGAGSISAFASKEVDASIAGAGKINVKGNPEVRSKSVKGAGRINIE